MTDITFVDYLEPFFVLIKLRLIWKLCFLAYNIKWFKAKISGVFPFLSLIIIAKK